MIVGHQIFLRLPMDIRLYLLKFLGCPKPGHYFAYSDGLIDIEAFYIKKWREGARVKELGIRTHWGGIVSDRVERLERFKVFMKFPSTMRRRFRSGVMLPIESKRLWSLIYWMKHYNRKKKWRDRCNVLRQQRIDNYGSPPSSSLL